MSTVLSSVMAFSASWSGCAMPVLRERDCLVNLLDNENTWMRCRWLVSEKAMSLRAGSIKFFTASEEKRLERKDRQVGTLTYEISKTIQYRREC